MNIKIIQAILLFVFLLTDINSAQALQVKSPAFAKEELIPKQYACTGANQPPILQWQDVPQQTQSFAVVMQDPDAPAGIWYHWLAFNIPANYKQLSTTNLTSINIGQNSWKHERYDGPCPPPGQLHRYIFTLYALDKKLDLPNGIQIKDLLLAMQKHVLATASWQGKYQR